MYSFVEVLYVRSRLIVLNLSDSDLGDLANVSAADQPSPKKAATGYDNETLRGRKSFKSKGCFKSHLDGVRDVEFLSNSELVVTASEDHTLKLWKLPNVDTAKYAIHLRVKDALGCNI